MRRRSAFVAIALVTAVALLLSFIDGIDGIERVRAAVAIAAMSIAPGATLLALDARRRRLDIPLALALSPFVLGAVMSLLLIVGFSTGVAIRICAVAIIASLGFIVYRTATSDASEVASQENDVTEGESGSRIGLAAWGAIVLLVATIALPMVSSNRVRTSVHGMLHSSILYRLVDAGAPPENPFFAGETLRYYWTWHAAEGGICVLANVDPTVAFAASNLVALVAFLALLGRLGAALFPSAAVAPYLSVLIGFLGLNPLGAIGFRRRAEELEGFAPLDALARGEDPIFHLRALAVGHDERITATLTKFLNVSSFPHSLALLVASWLLLARAYRTSAPRDALFAAAAVAGCIVLSPITGLTGGLALGIAAAIFATLELSRREETPPRRRGITVIAALAAGLIVAIPFVLLGAGGGGDEGKAIGFDPTLEKLTSLTLNVGPLLLLAIPGLVFTFRGDRRDARFLATSALPLLLMAVVIWFPVDSEYKLTRMVAPLLGVFAAGGIATLVERRSVPVAWGVATLVATLFLPTNVLAWRAYHAHSEATLPFRLDGIDVAVDPAAHPVMEMYSWIRNNTPDDSVVVDNPRMKADHFAGPLQGDEIPVLARRPIFTDVPYYMTDYEPDFPARFQMIRNLFQGVRWNDDEMSRLRRLGRPVYVLLRLHDSGASRAMTALAGDPRFEMIHKSDDALLFEMKRGGR